jgi:hypothetical protein
MIKFLAVFVLLWLLAGMVPVGVEASRDIRVFVDSRAVSFHDQRPFIDANRRTMVPLRFVAQEIGATAEWLEADRAILLERAEPISGAMPISQQ